MVTMESDMARRVDRGFRHWLRRAMADAGITSQSELARMVGCDASTVSDWLTKGAWPRIGILGPLASALGVSRQTVEWHAGYDVPNPAAEPAAEPGGLDLAIVSPEPLSGQLRSRLFPLPDVPIGESVIAAGMDGWTGPIGSGVLRLFEGRANISVAEVSGVCMQPEIEPGDVVLIDRADLFPRAGMLVAFLIEGDGVMVKRLAQEGGQLVAVDNQGVRYQPSHAVLLGRVVAVTKRV